MVNSVSVQGRIKVVFITSAINLTELPTLQAIGAPAWFAFAFCAAVAVVFIASATFAFATHILLTFLSFLHWCFQFLLLIVSILLVVHIALGC